MPESEIRRIRGREIAIIFQEPMAALDPVLPIGLQITESLAEHRALRGTAARRRAIELLDLVGIPDARRRLDSFPHEFSGGMRQRAMIAIALAAEPQLLLADEPTTALDVTIQDQILRLLLRLRDDLSMSMILVTHDLGIVAGTCDRVAVAVCRPHHGDRPDARGLPHSGACLHAGPDALGAAQHARASETAGDFRRAARAGPNAARMSVRAALRPGHLRVRRGAAAVAAGRLLPCQRLPARRVGRRMSARRLLAVDDLVRTFPLRLGWLGLLKGGSRPMVRALNGVTLAVERGETLAVVGESGSGKSTLARTLVRLIEADSGQILFDGEDVRAFRGEALRRYNRRVQMVFQDPYGSLNPRMTVGEMLGEALRVHDLVPPARRDARIAELLDLVRLPADASTRLPHEFSGGQRQRIAIARALSVEPELLIADEIVSSLDVSVQAQILNLLLDLQEQLALAILFVSHDLRVVRHIAHRIAIMYLGRVVELGPAESVFAAAASSLHASIAARRPHHGAAAGRCAAVSRPGGADRGTAEPAGDTVRLSVPSALPRSPSGMRAGRAANSHDP